MSKVALITGATGGLGQAIATKLAGRGYQLVLVDFDEERLTAMATGFQGATIHALDQRDMSAVQKLCDNVIEQGPFIDVAVVNAGMIVVGSCVELKRQSIVDQIQVNLTSAALMIQSFARRMASEGKGNIIATVSMGGIVSLKGSAVYSASKFGLRGLLWGLRDELAPKGVHVSGVYPAGVDTPMLRHEAKHGGSALNFVSAPVSADTVAEAFVSCLDRPRLEVHVPWSEGVTGRVLATWPSLLSKLYPVLEWLGERGRRKFLTRIERA